MLIDAILDRKAGDAYSARELYAYCQEEGAIFGNLYWNVARAMDEGSEWDVREALCAYIVESGYNVAICEYVNSVDWLK